MKTKIFAVVLLASLACLASLPGAASEKGWLKGASVGGVGGHMLGGHSVAGAAASCAVGLDEASIRAAEANTFLANAAPANSTPDIASSATAK